MCQVPYGLVARRVELAGGGGADVDHLGCRHGPGDIAVVLARDRDDPVPGVGVASELGEHLVPRHPDGDREPELVLHAARYLIRHEHRVAPEEMQGARQVDPGLVEPERLHEVGVLVVDHSGEARVALVGGVVRRHDDELRALLPGLPYRLRRLHAASLGLSRLGEDDPVSALRVAGDGHRPSAQARVEVLRDGCVESVHVDMHDHALAHGAPPH